MEAPTINLEDIESVDVFYEESSYDLTIENNHNYYLVDNSGGLMLVHNSGKTTFLNFMMVNKSSHDKWKWCIWSPEMINSHRVNKKIVKSSSDIYDELIHTYTGNNPYKHFTEKYGIPQMSMDDYMQALEWVEDHFIVIDPKDKMFRNVIDTYRYWYEKHGFDGLIIDPFKNLRYEQNGTTDNVLHEIFDEFKECAIYDNTCINIVAHPRSGRDIKKKDGSYNIVTQHHLLGGSAWDNSMDGIFSLYRPYAHKNPNDVRAYLYHLKQRKKHLVGETGVYKYIEFNPKKNRFYFDGKCPIDGSFMAPIGKQGMKPDKSESGAINFDTNPEENEDVAPF